MRSKDPSNKKTKRIGRGSGSGHGKTSTRGHKGQKARSGYSSRAGFEGGQNPLYRRLPKRGFSRARFLDKPEVVNLSLIATLDEKEVTPEVLVARGVVKNLKTGLKVLGNGELSKAVKISAHFFSESAKKKIEHAGGQVIVIPGKPLKSRRK